MWDYDKLFAEGNIVGLHNVREGETYGWTVVNKAYWNESGQINWQDYFNSNLSFDTGFYLFEIQYIIRLNDKGQVAERLFDRDKDMPKPMPKLETGMFVYVPHTGCGLGFVEAENNHIIYQKGGFDYIQDNKLGKGIIAEIAKVYSKNTVYSFNLCDERKPIWEKSN